MSIYRLADASLTTNPEVMVVHQEMFRSFNLKGGSQYPIAFRGDDRKLLDVMATGFRPRTTVLAKYSSVSKAGVTYPRLRAVRAELETKYATAGTGRDALVDAYLSSLLAVNVGNVDIDKETAVCCTRDFAIAGMFPFDPQKPELLNKPTRVYVVRMRSWFETYRLQSYLAPHLAYSKEVACLGIPPEDILGCVMINRKLDGNNIVLSIGGSEQPGEHDETEDSDFDKFVAALPEQISVPVPKQKDTSTKELPNDEKCQHITAGVRSLTGIAGTKDFPVNRNDVRDNKPIELDDYKPATTKQKFGESPF